MMSVRSGVNLSTSLLLSLPCNRKLTSLNRVLKPGGWLQMIEFYYNIQSDNGSLTDNHALRRWSDLYLRANEQSRDLRAPLRFRTLFDQAGFVDVETRMIPVHLNGWSRSRKSLLAFRPLCPGIVFLHTANSADRCLIQTLTSVSLERPTRKYFGLLSVRSVFTP